MIDLAGAKTFVGGEPVTSIFDKKVLAGPRMETKYVDLYRLIRSFLRG